MPTPRIMDQVRSAFRIKRHSLRTEAAYLQGIKRYIFPHGKKHPRE